MSNTDDSKQSNPADLKEKLEKVNKTTKIIGWIIVGILGLIVLSIVLIMGGTQGDSAFAVLGGLGIILFILAVGGPILFFLSIAWGVMKIRASSMKAELNKSGSPTSSEQSD